MEGILFDWTLILHGTTSAHNVPLPTRKPRPSKTPTGTMTTSVIVSRKEAASKVVGKLFFSIAQARVTMFVCLFVCLFI